MNVVVNGEICGHEPGTTLGVVVDRLGRGRRGVAAAVNAEVVAASRWDVTVLADDDHVEILTAAPGG